MFKGMILRSSLIISFLILAVAGFAQIGGNYVYDFLDMPATSRIRGMGGNMIAMKDDDPGAASDNPSLLHSGMDRTLILSYTDHFAGINNLFTSYTFDTRLGTFNSGIRYLDYGKFREADEGNNELGSFTANEMALIAGYGRAIDSSFSVGANAKFIYSNLYLAYSIGMAVDLSATYEIKKSMFVASMLVKNVGTQFKPYVKGVSDPLPLDIQFGFSKSFKRMPFRFSLIVHQLAKGRLTYEPLPKSTSTGFGGEEEEDRSQTTAENILRHFIIGTEFVPFKGMNFQLAYNFQRRKEMTYSERPGTVGLSWGFGIRIKKLHINYARSATHLVGSPNHLTVLTRFSDWSKKE